MVLMMTVSTAPAARSGEVSIFSDLAGEPVQIETHTGNGRWLVVMIWASDCHICNQEAAAYERFHRAQADNGIDVLGISMDGAEKTAAARTFVERHDLTYPNIIGEPGMVSLHYQSVTGEPLRGTPTFVIYDPSGRLAAAQAGAVPPESIERFVARKKAGKPGGQ
jgi:peroxiredoxin